MQIVGANQEVYRLLKDGIKVSYQDQDNEEQVVTVQIINWRQAEDNDFLLVSQLWVTGETYSRRPDLVGFLSTDYPCYLSNSNQPRNA